MNFRHVRMLLLLFTMILWNVLLNCMDSGENQTDKLLFL